MLSTWIEAMRLIVQNVVPGGGGTLNFSKATHSALIAIISF